MPGSAPSPAIAASGWAIARYGLQHKPTNHEGRPPLNGSVTHVIVLPGGGYAQHAAHEGEPIERWLQSLGLAASVSATH